jgi:spore germination cell wall hydrolase CwlJ-like protein
MIPKPYTQLTDLELLSLCVWREARGEQSQGQRGVAHVCRNRTLTPAWYNGHRAGNYHAVILQPYQFSSFSPGDPNEKKWPADDDPAWIRCQESALWVPCGVDPDNTFGATAYYDTSITFPAAWGDEANWVNTLNSGRLRFWKPRVVV